MSLRTIWKRAKEQNVARIHELERDRKQDKKAGRPIDRYVTEHETKERSNQLLHAIRSFNGGFGPTLDSLESAYNRKNQNDTKWLAHRALCISERYLAKLNEVGRAGDNLGYYLNEINRKLVTLKSDGIQSNVAFDDIEERDV
jgi:hypothetical protein